jgi:hypothetical protein
LLYTETSLMANEKDQALDPKQPPTNADGTLKVDAAAERATDKAEEKALAGEANTGASASTNPTPLPAGEMRPSVEMPTLDKPVAGAPIDPSAVPATGKAAGDLLEVEQDLAWLIQHQPAGLDVARVPELRRLYEAVRAERYKEKPNADMVDGVKRALAATGIAPEAFPSRRK